MVGNRTVARICGLADPTPFSNDRVSEHGWSKNRLTNKPMSDNYSA
jgi:hypothetical protein